MLNSLQFHRIYKQIFELLIFCLKQLYIIHVLLAIKLIAGYTMIFICVSDWLLSLSLSLVLEYTYVELFLLISLKELKLLTMTIKIIYNFSFRFVYIFGLKFMFLVCS